MPPVSVVGGVSVVPPHGWSRVPTKSTNFVAKFEVRRTVVDPQGHTAVAIVAQMTIAVENRRDHAEAVHRLLEIAMEVNAPARFFAIDGWPAMHRMYTAPLPETFAGEHVEKHYAPSSGLGLFTTTAVAAGTQLVRVEGNVAPGLPAALADQVDQAAMSMTFSVTADPDQTTRELRALSAAPRGVKPPPPPPGEPSMGGEAPEEQRSVAPAVAFVSPGSEIAVAVSASGQNVVIASNSGFATSDDSGRTFTFRGGTPGLFPHDPDPSLGWGPSGSFYYGFTGFPNGAPPATGTGCAASVTKSTDTGQTFHWVGNAALCPLSGPAVCFTDQSHLAVDRVNATVRGDQVYVVWRNFVSAAPVATCNAITSGFVTPMISCSADGGASWPLQSTVGVGGDLPRVTVGGDGFVYVTYWAGTNVTIDKLSSCTNGLRRQTGFPVTVATHVTIPCPIPGIDRCNQGMASPITAVDDTNPTHLFVAYAQSTGPGNEDIVVRDSLDGGATWPGRTRANAGVAARRFMPWACAAGGAAQVSWYDRRDATPARNDLTSYIRGTVARRAGGLLAGAEQNLSGVDDAQCASGWACGTRAIGDSESCSVQPQLAGFCLRAGGGGSGVRCDFSQTTCPAGETCRTSSGCPKYGDYNGNACAAGRVYTAWASATPPPGVVAPAGINVFTDVSVPVSPANDGLFVYRPGRAAAWVARSNGDGTFDTEYGVGDNGSAPPNGIAGYDLLSPNDQVLPFDYDGDGDQDLFLYRPGQGAAWVARSNDDGTFDAVYAVGDNGPEPPNGIAGYDLLSTRDRALAFDYNGDGKQDLFFYRPGQGAAWVVRSNGDGTFDAAYAVGDNGPAPPNGIAGYDLLSGNDRVLSFDYNADGKQDLFLYRPGRGAAWVARSNGDGTFTAVYGVADNGPAPPNGIAGYDLWSPNDRVLAFDYNRDGKQDLFLYRPGQGAAWVARSNGNGTFDGVYAVGDNGPALPNGIGGYDLLSPSDRVLAFDYNGDGKQDLFLYRPGRGAAWVVQSNGNGTFDGVHMVGDNGPAPPNGIAGYDLLSTNDRVIVFDYNGDGRQDLFLYRPGEGAARVARSNGDGTFDAVYAVGDNGPVEPNGIAGYDLLSTSDQVIRFHYRR